LAHILEVCAELVMLATGSRIGYSHPHTLVDAGGKIAPGTRGDAHALRPTLIACVPVIFYSILAE
jgi:hypothetical protein